MKYTLILLAMLSGPVFADATLICKSEARTMVLELSKDSLKVERTVVPITDVTDTHYIHVRDESNKVKLNRYTLELVLYQGSFEAEGYKIPAKVSIYNCEVADGPTI